MRPAPGVSARDEQPRAGSRRTWPGSPPPPRRGLRRRGGPGPPPLGVVTRRHLRAAKARTPVGPARGQIRHTGVGLIQVRLVGERMRPPPPTCDVEVVWPFFSSAAARRLDGPTLWASGSSWALDRVMSTVNVTAQILCSCSARARGTLRYGRRQVHRRERERERGGRALRTRRLWTVSSILPRRPQRVLACTNTMHRSLLARASGHEADVEAQARGGRNATGRAGESVTRQPDSIAGVKTDRGARSHSKQVRVH